ncbi:MAG: two-CW domain-containing protein [Syntrophomonadaceae bacterium]
MEKKLNCWEFMKCGREPEDNMIPELGLCSAVTNQDANGINGGKNGGRICWAIAGSFCQKEIEGTFARKISSCMMCEFYDLVLKEEGKSVYSLNKKPD